MDCKSDTAVPHSMGLWFAIVLMCDQGTIQVESNISDLNPRYQEVVVWDLPVIGGIATELAGIGSQVQQQLRSVVGLTIIRSRLWTLALNR